MLCRSVRTAPPSRRFRFSLLTTTECGSNPVEPGHPAATLLECRCPAYGRSFLSQRTGAAVVPSTGCARFSASSSLRRGGLSPAFSREREGSTPGSADECRREASSGRTPATRHSGASGFHRRDGQRPVERDRRQRERLPDSGSPRTNVLRERLNRLWPESNTLPNGDGQAAFQRTVCSSPLMPGCLPFESSTSTRAGSSGLSPARAASGRSTDTQREPRRSVHVQHRFFYGQGGGGLPLGKPLRMADLLQRKKRGQKISMVTSYDANVARILDSALIDMQLVGDSLANVVLGLASTAAVDLHTMILFAKHVKQACRRSVVVFDLPYGTYHTKEAAVESVIQVVKQTGITAVKLEGFYPEIVKALREHVSVICHLGVQPQTAQTMNSRGKDSRDALELLHHSLALEAAGCQMIVLEKVCAEVAEVITSKLKVPTIGIGSGPGCDGQVLVFHDLCGLSPSGPKLKFVKQYAQVHPQIQAAVSQFRKDVETSVFPGLGNCFFMKPTERTKFYAHIEEGLDAQLGGNRPSSTFPAAPSTPAGGERDRGSFAPSIVRGWVAAGLANPASSASKAVHGATDSPPASGDKAACTNVSPKSPAPPVLKRVCVRGGGAMGQLMAWKLAGVPGVEVVLATHRQELKEAVEKQGNQLLFQKLWDEGRSPPEHGDVEGRPVRVIVMGRENDKVEKLAEEPFDAVLICTKSEQTAEAGNFALANVRSPGIVASFQNGLEAPRVLRSIFSDASGPPSDALLRSAETSLRSTRIQSCWNSGRADTGNGETTGPSLLFAPTSYGALEQAPGLVRLTGEGEIRLGLSSPRPESTAVPSLAALLRCAGLNVTEIDPFDVQAVLWQKVTVSAYVNAVTALLRCNNGDVANPLLQPLRRRVVEEVVSVARARGIAVDLEATDHLVVDVIHRSARNLSSMLVDVQKRRPTEIDAINGEVVKQGREVGVPTPVTETLLNLVRFITEQQSRNSSPAG